MTGVEGVVVAAVVVDEGVAQLKLGIASHADAIQLTVPMIASRSRISGGLQTNRQTPRLGCTCYTCGQYITSFRGHPTIEVGLFRYA